jgi:putative Flp pilus-assembly TadE/G-like protein
MKRNRQAGQALVFIALGLVVLTGVVGLSIDMGYLRYTKRRLQTAADSAAIAGASELKNGDYRAAALNDSKSNGFEDGVNGVTVNPYNPPVDPPFAGAGHPNYVEVRVQQNAPTFFMRVFGINSAALSASAVAYLGSSKGCIYALNLLGGINVSANVNAPGCGVIDNALLSLGGGCLNAASIGVVLNLLGGGCANPPPVLGIAPTPDPLAYLMPPGGGKCDHVNTVINTAAGVVTTLTPGVYCNGIKIAPGNKGQVIFAPGLYILSGGGFQVAGQGDVSGNGVTFYVAPGGSVQVGGTGNVTLTAPTNAPTPGIPAGILFFQDKTNGQNAKFQGGNLLLTGALYFPGASVTFGAGGGTDYVIIVAGNINFQGDINIGADYSTLIGGSPVKSAVLVQ